MPPKPRTRVLVRTLPLSIGNYGGILQAYALQQALTRIGFDPVTDLSVSNPRPVADMAERVAIRMLPAWAYATKEAKDLRDYVFDKTTSDRLNSFVDAHITGVDLFTRRGKVDASVLEQFDTFVAGSDQIWRWEYGDVKSYLFDFVGDDNARMITYAASFGHEHLSRFHRRVIRSARPLARRLHSVSVRETSAVALCEEHWAVRAHHNVDPTMLLERSDYRRLAERNAVALTPRCLTYVLDESPATRSVVDAICARLGMPETRLVRKPESYAVWRNDPQSFDKASIETWLRAFDEAQFVVTDSFHGTIFAILNNKPFIALSNAKRGAGRFTSLLGLFDLEQRLITGDTTSLDDVVNQEIDWPAVNQIIAAKRDEGFAYLMGALN